MPFLAPPKRWIWAPRWRVGVGTDDPKMNAEQVVALCFGITSALRSTLQRCIWAPRWRVGVGTGDPKMSAEQVIAPCFGITSALPSTLQRCIWAPRWRVGVGTDDPKMNAEQVVALRFGITKMWWTLRYPIVLWCVFMPSFTTIAKHPPISVTLGIQVYEPN